MKGKRFLIIGGSKGIGFATVEKIISEGGKVVNLSRKKGDWSKPDLVEHIEYDVLSTDYKDVKPSGSFDGILYCPGSINLKPFKSLKEEDLIQDIKLNCTGALKVIQESHKDLNEGAGIVLFSSVAVAQGMRFHTMVGISKGAIEGMTRSLAAELSPKIRVNAISPSLTNTAMGEKYLSNDEKKEAAKKRHPLSKYGEPHDIANLATFLLSDQSAWVTGQIWGVDGGLSAIKEL